MSANTPSSPAAATAGQVHASVAAGIAWLEIDNAAKLNAISVPMWRQLAGALDAFAADPQVRCVVVRGRGERAFCSGADVGEKALDQQTAGTDPAQLTAQTLEQLRTFPKPTVAMIQGYCLGGGVALAIHCDLRIAAEGAQIGVPAAKLGLGLPYAVVKRLADLVGPARAKWIIFTAGRLPAEEALRYGLVDQVAPVAMLDAVTRSLAEGIAAQAPLTIQAAKHAVETTLADGAGKDLAGCAALERACQESDDYAEGRRAFAEKRTPQFNGR